MLHLRILAFSSALVFAGCLRTPEPAGEPDTGRDDATTNANTPDAPEGGADRGPDDVCDGCTVGARQCAVEAEHPVLQVCEELEGTDGGGCARWMTRETCVGAQTCDPGLGCACENPCPLDAQRSCVGDGVQVCALVDECPTLVDIGRDETCAPVVLPDVDCLAVPHDPRCVECADGRECVRECEGSARGWACGAVPNP